MNKVEFLEKMKSIPEQEPDEYDLQMIAEIEKANENVKDYTDWEDFKLSYNIYENLKKLPKDIKIAIKTIVDNAIIKQA